MVAEKKEFKRHFPVINKCYCCCCMEFEKAIKVCTIIMIISQAIAIIMSYQEQKYLELLISIAFMVSLIFLAIGISNKNLTYMKQFVIIYVFYIIYEIIDFVLFIMNITNDKEDYKEDLFTEDPMYETVTEEEINKFINVVYGIMEFLDIIYILLIIYYYICVGSYVETIEEDIIKTNETRNLESNDSLINH